MFLYEKKNLAGNDIIPLQVCYSLVALALDLLFVVGCWCSLPSFC